MTTSSAKRFKQTDARQAVRDACRKANRETTPDRIAKTTVMPDGQELMELKPVSIPGYTYPF